MEGAYDYANLFIVYLMLLFWLRGAIVVANTEATERHPHSLEYGRQWTLPLSIAL
jgi:hypothetical protein